MTPTIVIIIVWMLLLGGLAGTILPGLPGVGFVFGGILLYALYFGMDTVGTTTLILLGAVTIFSFVIDFLASLYGAARFGATRSGIVGSIAGGLAGLLFLSLPGLLLGTFFGAVVGEFFIAKKSLQHALRAGMGSVLGFLAGSVIKFVLSCIMVIVFVTKVWF